MASAKWGFSETLVKWLRRQNVRDNNVFLNTFSNIFAWDYNYDCTDISISDIKFTQSNQVEVTAHGPQRYSNREHFPCCLHQGPMLISNYTFFYTNEPNNPIATTVWKHRQWVNGYSEDNSVELDDYLYWPPPDCDKEVYQGAINYTRTNNFDASRAYVLL
ncbi:hypothetical protein GLOIN_2v1776179 [Rhizophagus irregularis DAOM 181602=DAOM 197198]|uniref:Uncharacterized protein n=1 Tax=Rhizophagus irregularis (strain DAOM 181602 / DAOM 197198 / MUCL 43194) TaxID=747089 RepID=A0A2P4PXL7_RHIID|nr:hypothetical protein GLOIN_2v1776179 [Rhizophagus irregularis DAOM 181602=DAOM 197198]POG70110.1 hypothetical protein GLOIN_2v1776179 [Rhizophagus irregularis DAOM 181602=DAOM 197198]|eukprot:XP_025176976.1 hypothetical protein GLOIN_2v1776179 [Rhizophagus irregularis DAOM 181602=DAOM 197198]